MWRRVLSQSPTKVPDDPESSQRTLEYLDGWKALGALLHSGHSLSGRERNCCFLNLGGSRFVDAASAVAFDYPSDSRGIGVVDWDRDGDLDLWITNRTAPRVRYLQNDIPNQNHFVAFKLRGTKCNRDAIGARVQLFSRGEHEAKSIQSVSAGEGFVSQSSKWIHFGLGKNAAIERVVVQWPGGDTEEFKSIEVNQHYEVIQGSGQVVVWTQSRPSRPFTAQAGRKTASPDSRRTILAHRIPMAQIELFDLRGEVVTLERFRGQPALLNLWASWCQPCIEEFRSWKNAKSSFDRVSLTVVPINVEFAENGPSDHLSEILKSWQRIGTPFDCYAIDAKGFELFEIMDRIHFLHRTSLPIPSSFLIDRDGKIVAIYKGPVEADQIVSDVERLTQTENDPRDFATPLPGKWYSDPYPPNLTALPLQLNGLGRANDAFDYIMKHVAVSDSVSEPDAWARLGVPVSKVQKLLHGTAQLLEQSGRADDAITMFEQALRYDPSSWDTRARLSSLLIRRGRSKQAMAVSQEMVKLNSNHPLPWNNIAWLMATSHDAEIRNPAKAVELAERICQATGQQEPTALDTLAVAYASAGRFEEARATARKGLELSNSLGMESLTNVFRGRLLLFEKDQPFEPKNDSK